MVQAEVLRHRVHGGQVRGSLSGAAGTCDGMAFAARAHATICPELRAAIEVAIRVYLAAGCLTRNKMLPIAATLSSETEIDSDDGYALYRSGQSHWRYNLNKLTDEFHSVRDFSMFPESSPVPCGARRASPPV